MTIEETISAVIEAKLRAVVREEVRALAGSPAAGAPAPLDDDAALSVAETAKFLGQSESLVRKLERLGRLPALPRISRRLNFDPRVVRAFRAGTLKPAPQLARRSR